MRSWTRAAIVVGSVAFLCGCPSVSTMGMARTLDQGHGQLMMAAEAVDYPLSTSVDGTPNRYVLPQVELAGRYGLTDRLEIGGKAWLLGAGADLKIGVVRSEDMQRGVDVSIDPGISYLGINIGEGDASLVTLTLPVLVGINFGGGHQLVLGPKVVASRAGSTGAFSTSASAGGSLGIAFKLMPNLRLLPEVAMTIPVYESVPGATMPGPYVQFGLGMLVGGWQE